LIFFFQTFQATGIEMNFQLLHYREFEGRIRLEFYEMMDKYHSLKQKEQLLIEARECKLSRKDILLQAKSNNTITKIGVLELNTIASEENVHDNYRNCLSMIESRRAVEMKAAEDKYQRALDTYNLQKLQGLARIKREYDAKKDVLVAKGEAIEVERTMVVKSVAEIALEKQKYDLLRQMNNVISRISISRSQCPQGTTFDTPMLTLPEPLPSRTISPATSKPPTPPPTPPPEPAPAPRPSLPESTPLTQNIGKYGMPLWLENMGEVNLVLREQALREDAEARKLAEAEENEKKQEALARRANYERELAERRRRNEELKKQKASDSE